MYGKFEKNPPIPPSPKHLLFICKGNICRSPFAERLARKMILDRGIEGVSVDSAGFEAVENNISPLEALISAPRFGISLEGHSAKALQVSMMERADMVLVMEAAHRGQLEMKFPINNSKLYLLPLFGTDSIANTGKYFQFNVPDPYGQAEGGFTNCYLQIDRCLNGLLSSLYK